MPAHTQNSSSDGKGAVNPPAFALTGKPDRLWVRPLWLNPEFWEARPAPSEGLLLAAAPNGSAKGQTETHKKANHPSLSVALEDHRGKPLLQASGRAGADASRFHLQEGQLNWEGSTIRLPPELHLVLEPDTSDLATLTLFHDRLGPFCTFQSVMISQGDGRPNKP